MGMEQADEDETERRSSAELGQRSGKGVGFIYRALRRKRVE